MTYPIFLTDLPDPLPGIGARVALTGDEGRHAVVVRRIGPGEVLTLADGRGRAVQGAVVAAARAGLEIEVAEQVIAPAPQVRWTAAQALAKGDRSELAIEMMTEMGVGEVIPWAAARSIVRWSAERGDKAHARWTSTVREAAKQSRRLHVPHVRPLMSTRQLAAEIAAVDLAVVLHEEAEHTLAESTLPTSGVILVIVGPEGGITPDELSTFVAAGARPVLISDGVLRTSTAGVVALAQISALGARP